MATTVNTLLRLSPDEHAAAMVVAARCSALSPSGPRAGEPSLVELVRAIAAGAVSCRRVPGRAARISKAARVRALLDAHPDYSAAQVARMAQASESLVSKVKTGER